MRLIYFDFAHLGWRIGPWFIGVETIYRIEGWWPPERHRRQIASLIQQAESIGFQKGFATGKSLGAHEVVALMEQKFEQAFGVKL